MGYLTSAFIIWFTLMILGNIVVRVLSNIEEWKELP